MFHIARTWLWFNVCSHAVGDRTYAAQVLSPIPVISEWKSETRMTICGGYTITDDPMRVRFTESVMTMQDQSEFFQCDIIFMTVMQESH